MSNDRTPFLLEGKAQWNEYVMSCEQDILIFIAEEWLLILRAITLIDQWEIDEDNTLKISSFLLIEKKIPYQYDELIKYGKEIIFPYLSMEFIINKIDVMDINALLCNDKKIEYYLSSRNDFWVWLFTN